MPDPEPPSPRERELQEGCLAAMRRFQAATAQSDLPPRMKAWLWERMQHLLQFLVVCKGRSLPEATRADLDEWLAPTAGLYERDLRLMLFSLLSGHEEYAMLRSFPVAPGAWFRKAKDALFHGRLHREIARRTRGFFESIRQEDIETDEHASLPYYRALWEVSPDIGLVPLDTDVEVVKRLLALGADPASSPSVVDIGCGRGRLLRRIAADFPKARMTGIEMVEWYHPMLAEQGITPVKSHAGKLDLPDASQDIVVSTDVIEHLRHPEEMVREIHRVLKPGGLFCVGGPAANASFYNRNPLTYIWIALGNAYEPLLPPFHNLYAPLTPLRIVHYGFTRGQMRGLFSPQFPDVNVGMARFLSLRKFGLQAAAPRLPLLRGMGSYCLAWGRKS